MRHLLHLVGGCGIFMSSPCPKCLGRKSASPSDVTKKTIGDEQFDVTARNWIFNFWLVHKRWKQGIFWMICSKCLRSHETCWRYACLTWEELQFKNFHLTINKLHIISNMRTCIRDYWYLTVFCLLSLSMHSETYSLSDTPPSPGEPWKRSTMCAVYT